MNNNTNEAPGIMLHPDSEMQGESNEVSGPGPSMARGGMALEAYLSEHPDAVEDIEKARAMAEAGNALETEALGKKADAHKHLEDALRTEAEKEILEGTGFEANPKGFSAQRAVEEDIAEYGELRRRAQSIEEKAGEAYDGHQEELRQAQQIRNERYKQEHPEAVEDVNEAYAMAKAGDRLETLAAINRAKSREAISEDFEEDDDDIEAHRKEVQKRIDIASAYLGAAEEEKKLAEEKELQAQADYRAGKK